MSIGTLLVEPAIVHQRGTVADSGDIARDRYNNPVLADTDIETFGYAEQRVRSETNLDAQLEAEEWLVMLLTRGWPAGQDHDDDNAVEVDLDGIASVTIAGLTLELIGPPWLVFNPIRQDTTHFEARGRKVA